MLAHTELPKVEARWCEERRSLLTGRTTAVGEYKLGPTLGRGVSGKVKQAASSAGQGAGKCLAAKVLPKTAKLQASAVLREAQLQMLCHAHETIPTVLDVLQTKRNFYLVMEGASNGDLFTHVLRTRDPVNMDWARSVMGDLFLAVAHLHDLGVAHRDIKPENVLIADDPTRAMLCDFGHAVRWQEGDPLLSDPVGTIRCMPPEMFQHARGRAYDPFAMDMWGLGVVLFFVLARAFPFDERTPMETGLSITQMRFSNPLPSSTPPEACNLLKALLQPNPALRARIYDVLLHPFFT